MAKRSADTTEGPQAKRIASTGPIGTTKAAGAAGAAGDAAANPTDSDGIARCFALKTVRLYLSLAPCHVANPLNGIKAQHLDPMVMRYYAPAGGVVLAFANVRLDRLLQLTDLHGRPILLGRISELSPFVFLWVTAELLVWSPRVGDVLEGHSYMQTALHIGLLVHDTFNALIKKFNIPQGWQFVPNQDDEGEAPDGAARSFGHWADENGVKVEGRLRFTVRAFHTQGKVVLVEGTLVAPGAERDAQPVLAGKHKVFEEEAEAPEAPETVPEAVADAMPAYESEDGAVVNDSDSDDE